ncbi:bestrophin family ion channel [Myxococcus sp. MISCRS1]|uniref:bestrophin family protein n=1 Tax=Myxococcus sp. MISCRS1 TaxID=2996786 RepID=UPI00226EF8F1|nr:bestrophin family ion channel [Myxococcus sp. MISCRS1]MCY1001092.1 bestrophin family ion channel [Myxococcus sp. MISCRS1]
MIVRPRMHWLRMLFVWRGSVMPRIFPRLGFFLALACLAVVLQPLPFNLKFNLREGPLGLLGVALAIFLGFRNSTAYDRFWEARKLWGSLQIVSRSFMRQALSLPTPALSAEERRDVTDLLRALALTLNHQLRGTPVALDALPPGVRERVEQAGQRAPRVILALADWVARMRREGRLGELLVAPLEANLDRFSEVLGGCERIASTPIPYVYSVMLHRTVYIYSLLLPFALAGSLGWSTPLVSVFVTYTFIALDMVTSELEDPFGTEPNDLPLDALTRNIERAVLELAGEPLPPPTRPDDSFLLT